MALINTYFTPREITGYARSSLRDYPVNQPSLARFLPYNPIEDIEFRFLRGDNGLVQLAPFRAYDTEASIAGRKGVQRVTGSLPPISRKKVLGEYDQLRRRANPNPAIQDYILRDVDDLVQQIGMSFEFEMGSALVNGTVTPPGLSETVSFGRDSSMSVTANTLWSNTGSSDPINDLRAWAKAYRQKNGVAPGVILMSEDMLTYLLQSAAVRAMAASLAGTPTIIDEATLGAILTRNRLPQVETYEVQYDSDGAGTAARVIPNNVVLLLPAPVDPSSPQDTKLGATFLGTPAEADNPKYDLADSQAGLVAANMEEDDPPAIWTRVSGIGMATLSNPNLAFKAVAA